MKNSKLIILGMLFMGIMFLGFQCSSTELTSAKLYIQQKNWDKAIETLNTEVTKNPKSDEGYFLLGLVYLELDSVAQMITSFNSSLAISAKFAKDIENKKYELWGETMNKGLAYYNRSVTVTDNDSVTILLDKAIPNFKTATIIEPDSGLGYQFLAFSHLRKNEIDQAIDPLNKMVELEKAEVGYQYLGEVYNAKAENKMNEFKNNKNVQDSIEAIQFYEKSISILKDGTVKYPENSDMMSTMFTAYIGANKMNDALTSAKSIKEKDPNNKFTCYNYAYVLLKTGNYQEAETQFLEALKIDPEYENATYNLAVTYVSWGTAMNKEAEQKGVMSDDYKQKYQSALPYLEKVVEKDPSNAAIWELLGKVYSVLGMQDDANNAFKKADELR